MIVKIETVAVLLRLLQPDSNVRVVAERLGRQEKLALQVTVYAHHSAAEGAAFVRQRPPRR